MAEDSPIQSSDHDSNENQRKDENPSSEIDLPELTAEQKDRVSEELYDQLQIAQYSSWVGQLPHPADLRAYEEICPGSAQMIVDNMIATNRLLEKGMDNEHRSMTEFWTLKNREEDRYERESNSDRGARDRATFGTFIYMFLQVVAFVLLVYSNNETWVKVAGFGAIATMNIAPAVINALRGRHSANEKSVIETVPDIIRASKGEDQKLAKVDPARADSANT